MFLLDTNTVSYYIPGMAATVSHVQAQKPSTLAISSITTMELIYGIGKRGSKTLSTAVQSFMSDMTIVPFDQAAAQRAGVLRAVLERMGVALSLADGQIAGHALALDMTLVSADADFKKMSGLKVKDWSKY